MSETEVIHHTPEDGLSDSRQISHDESDPDPEATSERFRLRAFFLAAGILLLLIPLTYLVRSGFVAYTAERTEAIQRETVTSALDDIEAHFSRMQGEMLERARRIADAPDVISGLRTRLRTSTSAGPVEIVDYFTDLDIERNASVELYDFAQTLVAWNGFSMPLDDAPVSQGFFDSFHISLAKDANLRAALVVWWPISEGTRILGAVRVMRLIGFDAPVHNEFLRDISLADRWSRLTRLPVDVHLDAESATRLDAAQNERRLVGIDGSVLGRVIVETPSRQRLVSQANERFTDILVLWPVLLSFWIVGGLTYAYMRTARRARPGRSRVVALAGWFTAASVAWWGTRYALLLLDVPARWQSGKAPLAPLFDPMHFASGFGGGLMRSTGDFLISSIFMLAFAGAFACLANEFRHPGAELGRFRSSLTRRWTDRPSVLIAAVATAIGAVLILALTVMLAMATNRAVLDSTFDFFARRGLLPEPLLLVVFCALLLATIAVILISVGIVWMVLNVVIPRWPGDLPMVHFWSAIAVAALTPLIVIHSVTPLKDVVAWPVALSFMAVAFAVGIFLLLRQDSVYDLFILRSVLPSVFIVTVLLYPLLYHGMDTKRRLQITDAADTFAQGRDPRVLFAIEQILQSSRSEDDVRRLVEDATRRTSLDSLAMATLRGSLLSALPHYDVSMTFFSTDGRPIGRYYDAGQSLDPVSVDQVDRLEFDILRQMYEEGGSSGMMVEQVTGRREPERHQYEGIAPVLREEGGEEPIGWVMVRAEPHTVLRTGGTPFPRVLLPSGSYDDLYTELSVAEFRDGLLVRSTGRDFGRFRLSADVILALAAEADLWLVETIEGRTYHTHYRRQDRPQESGLSAPHLPSSASSIIAVRVPSTVTFDHLYYLLRLTVSGLILALPLYVFGLGLRLRAGQLPAPRVRFRDKVLNAFLGVGIISVTAVGYVGLKVITGENERTVQSWLRQHLERVEESLALESRAEEMPYRVLERTRIDSLAARIGLDLNVYREYSLSALSRPQLLRERLIDHRLPIEAYKALYFDGYRFIHTEEHVGNFEYTAGFRAIPDEQGLPQFVISLPTLPEQEQLEEERARTVAYLFGALLLLVVVVMITASLLANALSRPIARVRSGLQAVAAGRFERMIPVDSRDEIGALVQTFNEMQEQLAESRRKLAQQERQLAWREMARQVAHEIKNPLTPMKLSVQHLRRAFHGIDADREERTEFEGIFDRITSTLIEQIDTLARIANEFQSFARMPSQIVEKLDLNAVVEEAVSLMQEESDVEIVTRLSSEKLIIEADREELRRDYINLIKNAIQSIPLGEEGRVEVRTRFEPERDGGPGWAYGEVEDTGTGVEEEARDKIFEPNFSTKTSGTGLGLAIVRKSVEEHHGDIGFTTELGKGSTFWIRLPLAEKIRSG